MQQTQNSRKIWNDSYVFRTINISKLLGKTIEQFNNMLNQNDIEDEEILFNQYKK